MTEKLTREDAWELLEQLEGHIATAAATLLSQQAEITSLREQAEKATRDLICERSQFEAEYRKREAAEARAAELTQALRKTPAPWLITQQPAEYSRWYDLTRSPALTAAQGEEPTT